ncbi:MAG: DUF1080 domain-containing protein [Verrucomicrobia bacterium]|nr:DUF1080 domain-containing protein [Verrucomicrobiota bacterium]
MSLMRILMGSWGLVSGLVVAAAEPAVPDEGAARAAMTAATKDAEGRWTPLFNGRDLAGWSVKCVAADTNKVYWRVADGAIVVDSTQDPKHDYVWLMADGEYGDFLLRLRFQPFRGIPGNSGVQIRSRFDDAAGWLDGPQVDIHPPGPWRTGFIYDETRGVRKWIAPALARVSDARPEMAPAGVAFRYADDPEPWNDLRILARNTRVIVELNGRIVRDADLKGVLDDAPHRERSTGLRGRIALQLHARDALRMRFRDIAVAETGR